jgi:hypothetical protein
VCPLVSLVASNYLRYLVPSTFDAHGRGTHSPWTSAPSPTLREGACNQVSCLDLWVPRFPINYQVWRAIHCQSNRLWVHLPVTLARPVALGTSHPFTSAFLNPPSPRSSHMNVMLTNSFYDRCRQSKRTMGPRPVRHPASSSHSHPCCRTGATTACTG